MMLGYHKFLLDTLSSYEPRLDRCSTRRHDLDQSVRDRRALV